MLSPIAVSSSVPRSQQANAWARRQKIGNAHLQWAFAEAVVLFLRNNPAGQHDVARLEKKHGQGKALTILAHKLARAVSERAGAQRPAIPEPSALIGQPLWLLHTRRESHEGTWAAPLPSLALTGAPLRCSPLLA